MHVLKKKSKEIYNEFCKEMNNRMRNRIKQDIYDLVNVFEKKYPIVIEVERGYDTITIKNEFHHIEIFKKSRGMGDWEYKERLDYINDFSILEYLYYKIDKYHNELEHKTRKNLKYASDSLQKYD